MSSEGSGGIRHVAGTGSGWEVSGDSVMVPNKENIVISDKF